MYKINFECIKDFGKNEIREKKLDFEEDQSTGILRYSSSLSDGIHNYILFKKKYILVFD